MELTGCEHTRAFCFIQKYDPYTVRGPGQQKKYGVIRLLFGYLVCSHMKD